MLTRDRRIGVVNLSPKIMDFPKISAFPKKHYFILEATGLLNTRIYYL